MHTFASLFDALGCFFLCRKFALYGLVCAQTQTRYARRTVVPQEVMHSLCIRDFFMLFADFPYLALCQNTGRHNLQKHSQVSWWLLRILLYIYIRFVRIYLHKRMAPMWTKTGPFFGFSPPVLPVSFSFFKSYIKQIYFERKMRWRSLFLPCSHPTSRCTATVSEW